MLLSFLLEQDSQKNKGKLIIDRLGQNLYNNINNNNHCIEYMIFLQPFTFWMNELKKKKQKTT